MDFKLNKLSLFIKDNKKKCIKVFIIFSVSLLFNLLATYTMKISPLIWLLWVWIIWNDLKEEKFIEVKIFFSLLIIYTIITALYAAFYMFKVYLITI